MSNRSDIRRLTAADIPQVLNVAHSVGWTQTAVDIERMLAYTPDGCFGLDVESTEAWPGGLGSTAMAFSHGVELGWIAMVLTHPSLRGRGLATQLMDHAVASLRARGTHWIKLDATDLGRPIYERVGFRTENTMERRLREPAALPTLLAGIPVTVEEGAPLPLALDRRAFGADRSRLLTMLAGIPTARTAVAAGGGGYALLRLGKRGLQLGPMVCADEAAAEGLVRWAIRVAGDTPIQWDLIGEQSAARALAERYGFVTDRVLHRMTLPGMASPPPFAGRNDLVYSIAGFDFG